MGESKVNQKKIGAVERRIEAWKLRRQGLTLQAIADRMGCSVSGVHKWLQQGMAEHRAEKSEQVAEYFETTLGRLEELIASHYEAATSGGDQDAAALVLRLVDREAKLLGLDRGKAPGASGGNPTPAEDWTQEELEQEARRIRLHLPTTEEPRQAGG